jgi:hypothetical protein
MLLSRRNCQRNQLENNHVDFVIFLSPLTLPGDILSPLTAVVVFPDNRKDRGKSRGNGSKRKGNVESEKDGNIPP